MSSQPTIVKYSGTATPTTTGSVIFDSQALGFGKQSFHLLGEQWFQWDINFLNSSGTAEVTGEYSTDGTAWVEFYSKASIAEGRDRDEVYVGLYQDVRFTFTPSADTTAFSCVMALNPSKNASKSASNDVLGGNTDT